MKPGPTAPGYKMIEERDVMVAMRDGVKTAVDIFRPDAKGKFPALIGLSPYGKGMQSLTVPPLPARSPVYERAIEAGDPEFLVGNGYVHIIGDVRGSGGSEGVYRGWMSKQEAEDGYDLVEWAAAQPWCDGKVGMVGISYYGTIQLTVAALQPPHLKAIMPWNAVADYYREATHHGGILQSFYQWLYSQKIGAEKSVSIFREGLSPEEFKKAVEKAKQDPDLRMYPELFTIVDCPGKLPCYFDAIMYKEDGPYYWERSPYTMYDKIKIPFHASSGWWAYAHQHLSGTFRHYWGIDAPKKILIFGKADTLCPLPREYNEEAIRWYDYWLKGKNTGIMDEPPIKIFVMGKNEWRFEKEWPLARTKWTKYYMRRWEGLSTDPEDAEGKPDAFVQQPPEEANQIQSVKYLTPVLPKDLEITGPIAFYFYASIDQEDTNWFISLKDVAETGREVELTKGHLKASHRALDLEKSKPYLPYHPHVNPEKVTPGKVYEYAIGLAPTCNVFRAGHQIKLEITSMDFGRGDIALTISAHYPYHLCSSKTTLHKIYHDPERPSHLLLPVIPT